MKNTINYFLAIFSSFFLLLGCQYNPATGEKEVNLMSENEETSIGRSEHPKIVKEFGGIYEDKKLQNYIESLGNFLVNTSEMPDRKFTFTILNTPIINAFALPGGYIYITRGLIYLCQNEAQLAGVIAHEIGHITAKHTARRYTQSIGTNILVNVLGTLANNNLITNLIGQSASLYLLSYSRGQEYEADELATRYMIRAGFDPREMANFLKIMEKFSNLQKKIMKKEGVTNSELLQTHPTSSKRVLEIVNKHSNKIPINPIIGRDIFLKKIDGILFGEKVNEGFFFKNSFFHKSLEIVFEFDKDFFFLNYPKKLIGLSRKDTRIIFDVDDSDIENDISYLETWSKQPKKQIKNFQSFNSNGLVVSMGLIENAKKKFLFTAIKDKEFIFRFVLITNESEFGNYHQKFLNIISSFKKINPIDLEHINPPKIRILTFSNEGPSLNQIIQNLNVQSQFSDELFFILNGKSADKISFGEKIKSIY